jgi:hypothetical protein
VVRRLGLQQDEGDEGEEAEHGQLAPDALEDGAVLAELLLDHLLAVLEDEREDDQHDDDGQLRLRLDEPLDVVRRMVHGGVGGVVDRGGGALHVVVPVRLLARAAGERAVEGDRLRVVLRVAVGRANERREVLACAAVGRRVGTVPLVVGVVVAAALLLLLALLLPVPSLLLRAVSRQPPVGRSLRVRGGKAGRGVV